MKLYTLVDETRNWECHTEAEAEIEAARREGILEGQSRVARWASDIRAEERKWIHDLTCLMAIERGMPEGAIRADERERIVQAYNDARHTMLAEDAFRDAIRSRGAAEPRCTCEWRTKDHFTDCPCYKPPVFTGPLEYQGEKIDPTVLGTAPAPAPLEKPEYDNSRICKRLDEMIGVIKEIRYNTNRLRS